MNKFIKKLQKAFAIPRVSVRFCFHNYKNIRVGRFPLIACYCPKCGKIKYGNAIYYDGSVYQKSYKGTEAIEFVKEKSDYLRERDKFFAEYKQKTGKDLFDYKEVLLREDYETIEEYDRIANVISNAL